MEEKWPSTGTDGGGDNLQPEQKNRKITSASRSSKCIRESLENLMPSSSFSLDLSRKDLRHLTEDLYKLLNLKVSFPDIATLIKMYNHLRIVDLSVKNPVLLKIDFFPLKLGINLKN